jgi:outer membrane biogenesis lipoprotein LolB
MPRSAAATLLVAAALLLSACSTTSASREPVEKSVSYEQLHGMMVKLANENALGGAATASIATMGANSTLASNP